MKKKAVIEQIQDKLDPYQKVESNIFYHSEILAYEADTHYRNLLQRAYVNEPESIDICLDQFRNVSVYRDEYSGYLYSVLPKEVIEILPVRGGVYAVQKTGVKFEPLSTNMERHRWGDLNISFNNKIWFWQSKSVEDTDVSSSISVPFSGYRQVVWYENVGSNLAKGDKVNLDLLVSFYDHDDIQDIYVPNNVGGVGQLIELTWRSQARKMGIQVEEDNQFGRQNKEE